MPAGKMVSREVFGKIAVFYFLLFLPTFRLPGDIPLK